MAETECFDSNVTYIYGPPKAQTPQTLRSSFVQACIYISQGYFMPTTIARRIWRNQGVIEGQTTQWPNKNGQQDTTIYKTIHIHVHKTKDRVTEHHLKPGVNSDAPEG